MQEFNRSDRIGAEIQRELAVLVRDEANDQRLAEVTIQEVRVTRDLSHAKVFFTIRDENEAAQFSKILEHAAGFLRRRLGHLMKLRTVPELHFVYDSSLEDGLRMSALIDKAVTDDNRDKSDG